ncbi:B12-binding domain-containing radical SAM protein [Geobacter sp. AOG2]|uniref:B12-binding domain-containing radical SAM protein n=1 Tax=Geobacter sp. AOG2 TaxID=1566347 RepID=UPI001CC5A7F2|nr:radical SAM protein [Geobacter sp. AOG2]GFE62144.1 B12-binding domain-containing radical SAM protein [Geobacter sp. AOG2]
MILLLVNPPYDINRYMGGLAKVGWVFPPVGLLYIAAYLQKHQPTWKIRIYDAQVEERNFEEVLDELKPDIVGITCQSALVYSTLDTARVVKQKKHETLVIVGGVHASLRPQDLLNSENVDLVVRGEGEETFLEVCSAFQNQEPFAAIAGVSFKDGAAAISHNPDRIISADLDSYPMPALDLVPIEKYRISPDMRTGSRLGLIITSRGCPYDCMFCANKLLTKRTYRLRSIPCVIEEIEYYLEHHRINQLMIFDDNFAVDKKRTLALCDEFVRRGYPAKFNWWAEARVDVLDEEILTAMKRAGCSIISLGLESGNQRLLDLIKKNITLEQTRKTVEIIHKVGIKSRASFILGLPTETRKESLQTIRFAYSLPLDQVRFSIATPFPGTELWDIAIQEGCLDPDSIDWTKLSLMGGYTDFLPVYHPAGRSGRELKQLQRRANLFFFLRPKIVWGYINRIKSVDDLFSICKGFFHLVRATLK